MTEALRAGHGGLGRTLPYRTLLAILVGAFALEFVDEDAELLDRSDHIQAMLYKLSV